MVKLVILGGGPAGALQISDVINGFKLPTLDAVTPDELKSPDREVIPTRF